MLGNDNAQNPLGLYAFKASRPKREFDEIIMHRGQHEIYLPGKDRWSPVEFSFYEPITGSKNNAAKFFWNWQKDISDRSRGLTGFFVNGFKRIVEYEMQSPGRGCVEAVWKYKLYNAWPIRVTPADLDYTDSGLSEISVELRFDVCVEE